jgi:hypothetical protein
MSTTLTAASISYVLTIKTPKAAINDYKLQVIDLNAQRNLASTGPALNLRYKPTEQSADAQFYKPCLLRESA